MGIIIKYIIKNVFEKKFRTFIIVISVTLSAALFFASSTISNTMAKMYEAQMKMPTGKADLLIYPNDKSPSNFFNIRQEPIDGVKFIVGDISVGGIYKLPKIEVQSSKVKSVKMNIRGFNIEELKAFNPIDFKKYAINTDFKGNYIIISTLFAEQYGFDVGDTIDIEIKGKNRRLAIWGIARPTGVFRQSPHSDSMTVIIPKDTIASLLDIRGKVNTAYVILEEGVSVDEVKDNLSRLYPRYTVREIFSDEEIKIYLKIIVAPFFLMTTMVLFMTIFIIYSTFKVITVENLPIIGTFRSIGATKK